MNERVAVLVFVVFGAAVGAALGSVSGNVTSVSTSFAAIAGGVGEGWVRKGQEPTSSR